MLLNKNVPIDIIKLRSERDGRIFYHFPILLGPPNKTAKAPPNNTQTREPAHAEPPLRVHPRKADLHQQALSVCRNWLEHRHPFLNQGETFAFASVSSGSLQLRVKKHLQNSGLIKVHKIQSGKQRVCIWEPTDKLYAALALNKPHLHSKGGYLHQCFAHHARIWAERLGFTVDLEAMLPNGKAVDAILRSTTETVYLELACSPPMDKEVTNLVRNIESGVLPSSQIVAVLSKNDQAKLDELIDSDPRLAGHRAQLSTMLLGSFLQST